ncbi:unnamed protein product, partial [marine sediment metagenome]
TPVIGSYSKTLSYVINDGEDGFLIDFGALIRSSSAASRY